MRINDKKAEFNPEEMKTLIDVLDQNALMRIIEDELPSYTGSKILSLSKLGINSIETLLCLEKLNRLDLSYNKLKSVRALETLKELTWINLSFNQLSGKGIRGILMLDKVVFLNLGNNRIGVIPDFAFVKMINMKCLLMNNNKLEDISFVSDLNQLNTLVLSNNNISSIPASVFTHLVNLRKLSLGHNHLTEFPPIFHIESLKEVNLNNNHIASIPEDITKLHYLSQLDLGNNLLENVTSLEVLASMKYLTKLNVSQNSFYGNVLVQDVGEAVLVEVNQKISLLLPQLTTLNNRLLELGREKKVSRKRHYDEITATKQGKSATDSVKKLYQPTKKSITDSDKKLYQPTKKSATDSTKKLYQPMKESKEMAPKFAVMSSPNIAAAVEEKTVAMSHSTKSDLVQSGIVGMETAYNVHKEKKDVDVVAFLKGESGIQEGVKGWDD